MNRPRQAITVLLVSVLLGCVTRTAPLIAATQTSTSIPLSTQKSAKVSIGQDLISRRTESPPMIDGQIEKVWASAEPLRASLTWGPESTEHALDVELRAVHTDETIYFMAQWPDEPPSGQEHTVLNKLTLHWRIPEPAAEKLDCAVVCHTAFADGNGHLVYANTETIPQGGSETLSAAGQWDAGTWTLEWSRPLLSDNPFDLQFGDPDWVYPFRIKVFERIQGRPDPTSERHYLVFQP